MKARALLDCNTGSLLEGLDERRYDFKKTTMYYPFIQLIDNIYLLPIISHVRFYVLEIKTKILLSQACFKNKQAVNSLIDRLVRLVGRQVSR